MIKEGAQNTEEAEPEGEFIWELTKNLNNPPLESQVIENIAREMLKFYLSYVIV